MIREQWYLVRCREPLPDLAPPPADHPKRDLILAKQAEARQRQPWREYKMWGPQIAFLLKGEEYEVLGPAEGR